MGWAFAADIPLTSITKAEATNARVYAAGTLIRPLAGQRVTAAWWH